MLRPGGALLASTPSDRWRYPYYRALRAVCPTEDELFREWGHVRRGYSLPDIERLVGSPSECHATFISPVTALCHDVAFSRLPTLVRVAACAAFGAAHVAGVPGAPPARPGDGDRPRVAQGLMPGPAPRHVAILPWGDVVEDFLDPIGRTLDDFANGITGGWLWGYVRALATCGVRATVIVVSRTASVPGRVVHEPTGTPLVVLPSPWRHRLARRLRATHLAPYLATPLVALTTAVRRAGCDALLCQEYEWARFDACVAVGSADGVPVFATFQGGDFQASRYERLIRRTSLARASGVVIAAAGERERVRARYGIAPERIAAVPNPIDLELWFPDDRLAARAALGLPPDVVLAVWHGRVDVQSKGLDVLLDAWAAVRRARPGRRPAPAHGRHRTRRGATRTSSSRVTSRCCVSTSTCWTVPRCAATCRRRTSTSCRRGTRASRWR